MYCSFKLCCWFESVQGSKKLGNEKLELFVAFCTDHTQLEGGPQVTNIRTNMGCSWPAKQASMQEKGTLEQSRDAAGIPTESLGPVR